VPPTAEPRSPQLDLDEILADRTIRIVVCCGSGGVGKTTTAAALALRAAEEHGRRTVVLTIDPARRLAQALGLTELDNTPRQVKGLQPDSAELQAMMLDMKRTFDEVVLAHTDPKKAEEIFANPFYQAMSSTFSGTQEYMAMEKLGQLRAREEWDLIVVDTPPSRSALDFLDAPARLSRFLDGRMLRLLLAPARAGGRSVFNLVSASFGLFSRTVTKILGAQLLTDLSGFVGALDSMFGGFRERAEQTYRVLQAPETAFLVVAAPEPDAVREAVYFAGRLAADRMPLAGLVLNRVVPVAAPQLPAADAADGGRRPVPACASGRAGRAHPGTARRRSRPRRAARNRCDLRVAISGSAGRNQLLGVLLVAVHGRFEHLAPAGHLRMTAQQRTALALGHASPDPELDPVVEGVRQALVPHWTAAADPLRHVLLGTLDEQSVRVAIATRGDAGPVDDHAHISSSPLGLPPGPSAVLAPAKSAQTTSPHGIRVQFAGSPGVTAGSPATGTPRGAFRNIMLCSRPVTQRCCTRLTGLLRSTKGSVRATAAPLPGAICPKCRRPPCRLTQNRKRVNLTLGVTRLGQRGRFHLDAAS
jgi:anion-transporting  ArsA/GET3 family ATPase